MTLNVPYKIRGAIYVFTALGTPLIAYLFAKEFIGELEVTLWSGLVAAVNAMAAINTVPVGDEKK